MIKAILLSFIAHFYLIGLIEHKKDLPPGEGGTNKTGSDKGSSKTDKKPNILRIIDKPQINTAKKEEKPNPGKGKVKQKAQEKKNDTDCPSWYGGIGVIGSQFIIEVHPGYPAYRAGLMAGDQIISPDSGIIPGKVGSLVTVVVLRDGKTLSFDMIREKICTESDGSIK